MKAVGSPLTKRLVRGLGVLVAGAIVLRMIAQLIEPLVPLLIALFAMALSVTWIFNRRP